LPRPGLPNCAALAQSGMTSPPPPCRFRAFSPTSLPTRHAIPSGALLSDVQRPQSQTRRRGSAPLPPGTENHFTFSLDRMIHYSSRASVHVTSVRARLERSARDERSESGAAKSYRKGREEILPCAQARAQQSEARQNRTMRYLSPALCKNREGQSHPIVL